MHFQDISNFLQKLKEAFSAEDIWLDENGFKEENQTLSPGAFISKYGHFVIGTTVGGNAITISDDDDLVRFCDHTGWYEDEMSFAAKGDFVTRPYSVENVRDAQIVLATTRKEFFEKVSEQGIYELVDQFD